MQARKILLGIAIAISPDLCIADSYDPQGDPREPKPIYSIDKWPQGIASVPCSAWKKNDFGTWALTGTLEWTRGDLRVWAPTYQPDTPEGAIVENKCKAIR
jgi:hypothetical protein